MTEPLRDDLNDHRNDDPGDDPAGTGVSPLTGTIAFHPHGQLAGPGAGLPALARPLVASVGDILGLRPRRTRGDGGEVAGAWVDRVDALAPNEWAWVCRWLRNRPSAGTRRTYLGDVVGFLVWLDREFGAGLPGSAPVGLLDVTEDVAVHYREQLVDPDPALGYGGSGREGKPLGAATVSRRLATLSSLYRDGLRAGQRVAGLDRNPLSEVQRPQVSGDGKTEALSLEQTAELVDACERLALERPEYAADAAAVLLLLHTAVRVSEMTGLTAGQIRWTSGRCTFSITRKGGKEAVVPLPDIVAVAVAPLSGGRPSDAPLFADRPGDEHARAWDRFRPYTSLRRVAKFAQLADPDGSSIELHPHMLRATAATLLFDAGIDPEVIRDLLGHKHLSTTQKYNRGRVKLDRHGSYQVAAQIAAARR